MIKLPKYIDCELQFAKLMFKLAVNGIHLDTDLCNKYINQLQQELEEIDSELIPKMGSITSELSPLNNIYKKDGELKDIANRWIASGQPYQIDGTSMSRWEIVPANPNSDIQLRDYLLSLGWKPSEHPDAWNHKEEKNQYGKKVKLKDESGKWIRTSPKLPKEDWELDALVKQIPEAELIAKRGKRKHRLGVLKGYLKNTRADGRIPMYINPCGCGTSRVTHRVTCNVPRIESYMGRELKSVFVAEPGKVLVGCDMSGQEACMIAHLLGDQEFINFIVKNEFKYHKFFQPILKDYISDYNKVKSFNFAFLYGAQDEKLGSLCDLKPGNNKQVGAEVRKVMMKHVPGLQEATTMLEEQFSKYQAIKLIDGSWIPCRKRSALINTFCQGSGACVSKVWTCKYRLDITKQGIDSKHIIFYHDSNTDETSSECARAVARIMVNGCIWAGEYLNCKIPLSGEASVGNSWAEVK